MTSQQDSSAIARLLFDDELDVPLICIDSMWYSFEQLGISPLFMPFKVVYDSTNTAIYMRAADNTPESQAEFERAALRLSRLAACPCP